jgi:hypothetical protein
MLNFEGASKSSKEVIDTALKGYVDAAKGLQAISVEAASYSKKSFEDAVAHVETLSGVRSIEAAFELQTNFAKSSYENFVAEATKIGQMFAGLATSVYTPYQATAAKAAGEFRTSMAEAA